MLNKLLELFGVEESRAHELFLLFMDGEGERADKILNRISESSIAMEEKLFMTYIVGWMSAMKMTESDSESSTFFKTKTYVH